MSQSDKSLIIVEDEPVISILVQEFASDLGWRVEGCAATEADALSLLAGCSPRIALLDINLGGDDGLEVAQSCRARGIAVVLMTGYAAPDLPPSLGDPPLLSKPFSVEELAGALSRASLPASDAPP